MLPVVVAVGGLPAEARAAPRRGRSDRPASAHYRRRRAPDRAAVGRATAPTACSLSTHRLAAWRAKVVRWIRGQHGKPAGWWRGSSGRWPRPGHSPETRPPLPSSAPRLSASSGAGPRCRMRRQSGSARISGQQLIDQAIDGYRERSPGPRGTSMRSRLITAHGRQSRGSGPETCTSRLWWRLGVRASVGGEGQQWAAGVPETFTTFKFIKFINLPSSIPRSTSRAWRRVRHHAQPVVERTFSTRPPPLPAHWERGVVSGQFGIRGCRGRASRSGWGERASGGQRPPSRAGRATTAQPRWTTLQVAAVSAIVLGAGAALDDVSDPGHAATTAPDARPAASGRGGQPRAHGSAPTPSRGVCHHRRWHPRGRAGRTHASGPAHQDGC